MFNHQVLEGRFHAVKRFHDFVHGPALFQFFFAGYFHLGLALPSQSSASFSPHPMPYLPLLVFNPWDPVSTVKSNDVPSDENRQNAYVVNHSEPQGARTNCLFAH